MVSDYAWDNSIGPWRTDEDIPVTEDRPETVMSSRTLAELYEISVHVMRTDVQW